jgi:hypothetical protein
MGFEERQTNAVFAGYGKARIYPGGSAKIAFRQTVALRGYVSGEMLTARNPPSSDYVPAPGEWGC